MPRAKAGKDVWRPVTATDVARLAGVSQSAVSRAFTPGRSISEESRAKVLEAAATLKYRVNLVARSLITRRSNIVGVTMGYLGQYNPQALELLSQGLNDIGYRILLFVGGANRDATPQLEEVLQYGVDALVLGATKLSSSLAIECKNAGIPVVFFNRTSDTDFISSVVGDNKGGARRIAEFLLAAGHRRFGYIAGQESASTNRDRELGFTTFLQRRGLGPVIRVPGGYSFEGAMQAARDLFGRKVRPDAVFCASDHMAMGVMEVARYEFGLRIPEDVSVVGFGDAIGASWPSYSLTTYSLPIVPMVEGVVSTLQTILEQPSSPARRTVVPGDLIVRDSARIPDHGVVEQDGQRMWMPSARSRAL